MTVREILQNNGLLSTVIDDYVQRDGQIKVAELINEAYEHYKTVIINAPTGNGKSLGGLIPAILNKEKGRTIVSTATKSLQEQYQNKDIPALHKIFDFKSFVLKGRENYLCKNKFNSFDDFGLTKEKNDILAKWADETESGDFEELSFVLPQVFKRQIHSSSEDCLEEECPFYKQCYYRINKLKAIQADVLVVNHDLLALYLILKQRGVNILGDGVYSIIIDEAHKFEDIMTRYLGIKLSVKSCDKIISMAKKLVISLNTNYHVDINMENVESITELINSNIIHFFNTFSDFDKSQRLYPNDINVNLVNMLYDGIEKLKSNFSFISANNFNAKIKKQLDKFNNSCDNVIRKFDIIRNVDRNIDEYVYYIESNKRYNILNVVPIDISTYTKKMLFTRRYLETDELHCVVLLSATLFVNQSFNFIKERLGISEYYEDNTIEKCLSELAVPDIFDYKHQCLLYIPKGIIEPSNKEKDKKVFTTQMIKTIKELSKIVDGGILSLFTSYYELDKVYSDIEMNGCEFERNGKLERRAIFNQKLLPRKKIIHEFEKDKTAVLMATSSFWEGIDIRGSACSCVIIDKLPFPVPSEPIIEARIDKIKQNNGDWFNNYYLPLAIISLQQGFGRLIRTHKDMGIVVIMDNRIITKPYGRKIIKSLPKSLQTRNIDKVKVFFDIVRKKRKIYNK